MTNIDQCAPESIHFNEPQELNVLSQKILTYPFNRVLDVGCGGGTLLALIAQKGQFSPKIVCGIDLSLRRLRQAESFVPNCKVVCGDAVRLPFINSAMDLIVCSNLLEHVQEDYKMLLDVHRVLSKKGLFYLETILASGHGIYFYRDNRRFVLDPTHVREYSSRSEVYNLMKRAGFKVIESDICPVSHSVCDIILRILYRIRILSVDRLYNIYQNYKVLS